MKTIAHARRVLMAAGAVLLLTAAACGGPSEGDVIGAACIARGGAPIIYCNCFSKNMTDSLDQADLGKYAALLKEALSALSDDEEKFQRLFAEAMKGGANDPESSLRIGKAAQEAAKACMGFQQARI